MRAPPAGAGKYERVAVHGDSLVGNLEGDSPDRMVSVYLPPSYAKEPKRRYPVLYLLHGFTDSDTRWFGLNGQHFVNVQGAVDRAYAKGARELIVVMPDAFTKYQGSMYSSSATTGNWEGFVTQDLVSYVDKHYRTLPRAAICSAEVTCAAFSMAWALGSRLAPRQQGDIAYRLEKTPGYFIPSLRVP